MHREQRRGKPSGPVKRADFIRRIGINPFRDMLFPRMLAASCEVFENVTRRYGKPEWGIKETKVYGMTVPVKAG